MLKAEKKLIAEIGVNHMGSIKLAKHMINAGLDVGLKYFKFQIYKVEELCEDSKWAWYSYMKHCSLLKEEYQELYQYCKEKNSVFFASVFGNWSFDVGESIGMPIYKIASRSLFNNEKLSGLSEKIINTGKPVLASLGFYNVKNDLPVFNNVEYLYCVSKYPTEMTDITWPKFDNQIVGFSDHTVGVNAPIEAIARGAKIIEKHFTIDRTLFGPDQNGSATPEEMSKISLALHNK